MFETESIPLVRYLVRRETLEDVELYLVFDRKKNYFKRIDNTQEVEQLDAASRNLEDLVTQLHQLNVIEPVDSHLVKFFNHPYVENSLSAPLRVFLNPSGICNFSCKTCQDNGGDGNIWGVETAFRIAKEVAEMGVPYVKIGSDFNVVKYKGENYFFEFAKFLRQNGSKVSTSLIGCGVTPEIVEKMKELEIKVSVSLDGDEKLTEKLRSGTYKHAISALEQFNNGEYPPFIGLTLSKLNANPDEIKDVIAIAREYGAKGIKVRVIKPVGNAKLNELMIPKERFTDGTIKDTLEALYDARNLGLEIDLEDILEHPEHLKERPYLAHKRDCGTARIIAIRQNARITACIYLPEEYQPNTTIYDGKTLLELWQKDDIINSVKVLPASNDCDRCSLERKHHNECVALAIYYGGSYLACNIHKPESKQKT